MHALFMQCPNSTAGHHRPMPLLEMPGHSRASLGQSLVGLLLLSPGSWCTQSFVCALQESISPVLCKFWQLYSGVNGNLLHALIFITSMYGASLVAQRLKRPPPMRETRVRSLSREDPLEKEMVIHSSILAWRSNGRRSLVVIAHGVTKSRT